jgi:hypothetical protein
MTDARFIATLSDGSTVVEGQGNFEHTPGLRKPWIRLCSFAAENGLHLTSLRLNFDGRTVHLPRGNFQKFEYEGAHEPLYYAICYKLELENPLGGSPDQTLFVDLAAHYESFAVHYIQEIDGNNAWVVVTDPDALAPSPRKRATDA